ncbi:terminase [Marinomonas atlantica]|uniref:terminase n=1 Tax=Marinomonas atlantica TaxID=1806668 RepID=UPI00083347EC|nr:terminase [Marinomonas atlantica]
MTSKTSKSRKLELWRGEKFLKQHANGQLKTKRQLLEALSNKWFRLNSLYHIKNKDGFQVRFRPNKAQKSRYIERHCRDLILKARQLGFTTFEMIDALDDCLFIKDFSAGCICHKLEDAQDIFDNKIRFAYEKISESWLEIFRQLGLAFPKPESDRSMGYTFTNGSKIKVSTSFRGGTLQRLHVSEFGKICKQFPEKAREIVTGAFEAVGLGNQITLESTAEGREGYFFDYSQSAQKKKDSNAKLTQLDFQFHFFPWWQEPTYKLDPDGVVIPQHLINYFETLEASQGIKVTQAQMAWYAKKAEDLGDDMTREYPSYPDEAFNQSAKGAYFLEQMRDIRRTQRLTSKVHWNKSLPVITAWDLGMNDSMVIWFAQIVGREVHLIDYYENSGEGLEHYASYVNSKPYRYAQHYGPHDLAVRELGTGNSRVDTAMKFGLKFEIVSRISNHQEGIEAVRRFLPQCWFDEAACERGVTCLDNYRKEWDERLGAYKKTPLHDWASHGAKAFETLARAPIFEAVGFAGSASSRGKSGWGAHT